MGNHSNSSCAKSVRIFTKVILALFINTIMCVYVCLILLFFRFEPVEKYLEVISHVTTARFMHTYCFPFFLVFGIKQYVFIMIAAISSHISIILLKW